MKKPATAPSLKDPIHEDALMCTYRPEEPDVRVNY